MGEQIDLAGEPGGGLEERFFGGRLEQRVLGAGQAQAMGEIAGELVTRERRHVVPHDDALRQGFMDGHGEAPAQFGVPEQDEAEAVLGVHLVVREEPQILEKLRVVFRRMSRGNLLSVAQRAIELVPRSRLWDLVQGVVRLDQLAQGKRGAAPLLDEVRNFHDACLRGEYYDSFDVNSKNYMNKSEGTDAFNRIRAAHREVHPHVRERSIAPRS